MKNELEVRDERMQGYLTRIKHLQKKFESFDLQHIPRGGNNQEPLQWKVYVDGVVNQKGSGMGLVLISPKRLIMENSLRLGFSATNNEAKYEALLEGMSMVQRMGGKSATMFLDSRLVVG